MSFSSLGLESDLCQHLTSLDYQQPTEIQSQAIPVVLAGKDLLACAQTGTGKTASFVLPLLQLISQAPEHRAKRVRALILVPTRELAQQVQQKIDLYSQGMNLTSLAMYGGVDIAPQKQQLIEGTHILVATPGRLLDMMHQRAVHFDQLTHLVLDEADRMLDMGFIEAINKIMARLPEQKQTLLFSATLPDGVRFLAKTAMQSPQEINIAQQQVAAKGIEQWLITVDKDKKSALLSHLIQQHQFPQLLIFIQTKHGAAKLVSQLEKRGIAAEAFHSGRSQANREQLLKQFKAGKVKILIATGLASRGIDIAELNHVINYDLPDQADDYVHRIGRTGRAGLSGEAISFVSKDDFKNLCAIESKLGHLIERRVVEGFEPKKVVPVSILNYQPKRKPAAKASQDKTTAKASKRSQAASEKSQPEGDRNKAKPSNHSAAPKHKTSPQKAPSSGGDNPWAQWQGKDK
ncbi:DEAD/DEAH box helicase [Motilimonas pumila]|uniref:DEAD/DEAH box helicase n=1 Tax=Motilimonas pumila TaxID=2303987 RepID=A0A418YEQ0_9GAMM|nr:DEAD/DEAH box helicase [Motilimonas pumila]RJG47630.1 DEAD/DEAH box helicase [Motilimonas pumila]